MKFFHNLMVKLGRYRIIPDRTTGELYLERYYLLFKDRTKFPINLTLHKIHKSDDPVFHDHPWSYTTIILAGGYHEHTPLFNDQGEKIGEKSEWRGPGSIIHRKANEFHWLELDESVGPATTLFFMGKKERTWGFLAENFLIENTRKTIWVQFEDYLSIPRYKRHHASKVAQAKKEK
jgi:hypothetical protein